MRVVIPLPPSKNDSHTESAFFKKSELIPAVLAWHRGDSDGFKRVRRAIKVGRRRSDAYDEYTEALATALVGQRFEPIMEGDVVVSVTVFFQDRRRDLVNVIDVLCDSLESVLYRNDSQVSDFRIRREIDADDPRCVVTIEPVNFDLFATPSDDVPEDAPLREEF